jgi:succinate dehydrogenase / fumarate reductase, cytochrome b subunit
MSNRPLSPHLSIYKPQITSGTSIIGRLCGIYVYAFLIISLWSIVFSIYKYTNPTIPLYIVVMALKASTPLFSAFSYLILFITLFCVIFYTGTLVRHIMWDHNLALELKSASVFGYLIIAISVVTAIGAVAFIAIN